MINASGIPAEDLVDRLGLRNARLTAGGEEITFSCFGGEHSHGDEKPSAYINVDTLLWFCHGCKRSGNVVSLVMEIQQVSTPNAERWLREHYGVQFAEPIGGSMLAEIDARFGEKIEERELIPVPDHWLRACLVDWESAAFMDFRVYMEERKFSPYVLNHWNIGYDYTSDRITIPVYDVAGNLVGVKGRSWNGQEPKYLVLGDRGGSTRFGFDPYEPSDHVFGLHQNRNHKTVVLVEGELNAIALSQLGIPRPVATGMSYFSDRHAQLILREADECVVYYDLDSAGHQGVWGRVGADGRKKPGIIDKLDPFMRVRVVVPTTQDDPADLLEQGRGDEAMQLIKEARSPMALATPFV